MMQWNPDLNASNVSELDDHSGYLVWGSIRGQGGVVVGRDGSALFVTSAINPDDAIAMFTAGRRTSADKFPGTNQVNDR